MRKNCFDLLYQYFLKNAKCSQTNHFGVPIYYCSQNSCNKGYICSQCLTEDPEHFSNHVKNFIALDTRKNFFRFLEIPIDNIEESYTNNFIMNSRNKFLNLNKDKINDVNSFYDYIKNLIIMIINNNQKNNLIKDENIIGEYFNTKTGIKNKNNEFINNAIKDFINNDDKHEIINLINQIKPRLNQKNNEIKEKDKLNDINNLLSKEIPILIEKCMNILIKLDNDENNNNEINDMTFNNKNENNCNNNDKIEELSNELKIKGNEKKIDINNNENNKLKTNKIINIINDIKPMKNDIKILNIEFNNNNNLNTITDNNNKSFYEGSINNISSIKRESNLETEEFESKININMNLNNIEIKNQNINISPGKNNLNINKHPSVNDPFFNNKELSILDKEYENKNLNKFQFNNFGYKKKEKSLRNSKPINIPNNNNIIKDNSWNINHQASIQENNPTIAAANNIQLYNNNNNIINDLEIKLNQIHNNNNNLKGNFLKSNNIINKNNNDKIIKESNQFIIDIQKNNYGINQPKNTKSTFQM